VGTHRVGTVTNTYAYNGFGQRVRKFASTGATSTVIYVYDHQGKLIGEYSNTGAAIREYVWMQGEPLAVFTPNGTNPPNVFFLHNDHLGTPRVAMDGASNIRWRWLSEPFGTTAAENQPTAGQAALPIPLRMPGQMLDTETGLFYNWHRSYDSTTGRYTQSDPIGLAGGINTYLYGNASPLMYSDPNGLNPHVWNYMCRQMGLGSICDRSSQPRARCNCTSAQCPERQYTVGISLTAGGIGWSEYGGPAFVSGGASVGITSNGDFVVQGQAVPSLQASGAYFGVGLQAGVSQSATRTPSGYSSTSATQVDANVGLGPSAGGSFQFGENGAATGIQGPLPGTGRIGVGVGAMRSVGNAQTSTFATPLISSWQCTCSSER
jgi:RHS repeat-associated protein